MIEKLMIAAPDQAGGPLTPALQWPRVLNRCRGTHYVARLLALRTRQPAHRHLRHPVLGWEDRQTRRPGVDRTVVDVPAAFIRLGSIKSAGLEAHLFVENAGRQNLVGNVCGILPMVRERRLRQLGGRGTMRK